MHFRTGKTKPTRIFFIFFSNFSIRIGVNGKIVCVIMRSTSIAVAVAIDSLRNTCLRDKMVRPQRQTAVFCLLRMVSTRSEREKSGQWTIVAPRQTILPSFPLLPMPRHDEHKTSIKHENVEGDEEVEMRRKKNPLKYYWNWMEWTLEKDIVNNRETRRARLPVAHHCSACGCCILYDSDGDGCWCGSRSFVDTKRFIENDQMILSSSSLERD